MSPSTPLPPWRSLGLGAPYCPRQLKHFLNVFFHLALSFLLILFSLFLPPSSPYSVVLLVGAAGDTSQFSCETFPASSPHVIAAAATHRQSDMDLSGSNYGACIDIFAPGDSIPAPTLIRSSAEGGQGEGIHFTVSALTGSSASTAVVSGTAALVMSKIVGDFIVSQTQLYKIRPLLTVREMLIRLASDEAFGRDTPLSSHDMWDTEAQPVAHQHPLNPCVTPDISNIVRDVSEHYEHWAMSHTALLKYTNPSRRRDLLAQQVLRKTT
jgi:hypothetical protein